VTSAGAGQVGYRWRFREPAGAQTSGAVALASGFQGGPFHLGWTPRPLVDQDAVGGVEYYPEEMDLLPLPAGHFETLDLAQVHNLATLLPERNARYGRFRLAPEEAGRDLTGALLVSGKVAPIRMGEALLVSGPQGRGVVEIDEVKSRSIRYRWRFRGATSPEKSGVAEDPGESPLPSIRVGPYAVLWMLHSVTNFRDERTHGTTDWTAEIRYLPEEVSVTIIPAAQAANVDLSVEPPRPKS
jgi:hypothetical protein